MNKNVQIEVLVGDSWRTLILPDNASLTIKRSSTLFDRGDIFSYGFMIDVVANRHVLGNAATAHGEMLRDILDGVRANLYVMGRIYAQGYLEVGSKSYEEDGEIELSFSGGRKSFDKLIDNMKATDVPLLEDVQIGWSHDRTCKASGVMRFKGKAKGTYDGHEAEGECRIEVSSGGRFETISFPKFVPVKGVLAKWYNNDHGGVPYDEEPFDFTNEYHPYDDANPTAHPYCNIPVAYTRKRRVKEDSDYKDVAEREYIVSSASRINSAPNFYVMYWLRALFTCLHITIDENQMADIEDLTRLFFVNTEFRYKEGDTVHEWSHYQVPDIGGEGADTWVKLNGGGFYCKCYLDKGACKLNSIGSKIESESYIVSGKPVYMQITSWDEGAYDSDVEIATNDNFYAAFATSYNFPNEDVSSVIEALESAFGIRFVFSDDFARVKIVVLREVLSSNHVQHAKMIVTEAKFKQPTIRGVRWSYGGSDSDTQFHYRPFDKVLYPKEKQRETSEVAPVYDRWNLTSNYEQIKDAVSNTNTTCYIDPSTGNAYRIKVDKDTLLNGSLFEVAAYQAAVDGDVSGEDETIKEISIGFKPLQMNRIHDSYALYVGDEMSSSFYDPENLSSSGFSLFNGDLIVDTIMQKLHPDIQRGTPAWNRLADAIRTALKANGVPQYGMMSVYGEVKRRVDIAVYFNCKNLYGVEDFYPDWTFFVTGIYVPIDLEIADWDHVARAEDSAEVTYAAGFSAYYPDNYDYDGEKLSPIESFDTGFSLCVLRGPSESTVLTRYYKASIYDDSSVDGWDVVGGGGVNILSDSCREEGDLFDYNGSRSGISASPSPVLSRAQEACQALGLPPSWAERLMLTVPRRMGSAFGRYNDLPDGVSVVSSSYDGAAPLLYCARGMYVYDSHTEICHRLLVTPILPDGTTTLYDSLSFCRFALQLWYDRSYDDYYHVTADTFSERMSWVANKLDRSYYNLLVPIYDVTEELLQAFAEQWYYIMYGSYSIPSSNFAGRFSLKLRAEKPNPYYDDQSPESDSNPRYLSIRSDALKKRGLVDKFLSEYSRYLTEGRVATFNGVMPYADFLELDTTKKTEINGCTGFISSIRATLSAADVVSVEIEILYL